MCKWPQSSGRKRVKIHVDYAFLPNPCKYAFFTVHLILTSLTLPFLEATTHTANALLFI